MKIEAWVQIVYKIVQKEGMREQEEREKRNKPMCAMIGTSLLKPRGLSSAEIDPRRDLLEAIQAADTLVHPALPSTGPA